MKKRSPTKDRVDTVVTSKFTREPSHKISKVTTATAQLGSPLSPVPNAKWARVSITITEEDGSRLCAAQAGQDWTATVQLRVHRPVRLDSGLVLALSGVERVRAEPNKMHPVVRQFLNIERNLLQETPPSVLQPGTYTYPICICIPLQDTLPTMHIRHDRGATGISAHGRDMAYGSVQYEVTVRSSSFQRVCPIQVLPSPAAAPWQPRLVGPQAIEVGGKGGRIYWGASVQANLVPRNEQVRLYVSLVNESIAKIKHLRVEIVETVSLSETDVTKYDEKSGMNNNSGAPADYVVRKFPEVLWRLEHAPLDPEVLETGHKLLQHVEQMTKADYRVSSRAVLDDLEQRRPEPIAITIPPTARASHVGRLTRTQHQLRLTLLTSKKNAQLTVPLWIV